MPVYWFAISQLPDVDWLRAAFVFIILHLFLYPASNAYNSYMDRDTGSIGGVGKPLLPTKELFYFSIGLDGMALISGLFISYFFTACIIFFIAASRAYSYRGIRLKKYPFISYFTAIFFQGAVVYIMAYHGSSISKTLYIPYLPVIASTLLMGSFYPLTQIYQHAQDEADGVRTISMVCGYKGTFFFSAFVFVLALSVIWIYFVLNLETERFLVILIWMAPVFFYFLRWFLKVKKNIDAADFKNSLRMNIIAATCSNGAFITLLLI